MLLATKASMPILISNYIFSNKQSLEKIERIVPKSFNQSGIFQFSKHPKKKTFKLWHHLNTKET
jgi:hypothetical protein